MWNFEDEEDSVPEVGFHIGDECMRWLDDGLDLSHRREETHNSPPHLERPVYFKKTHSSPYLAEHSGEELLPGRLSYDNW